MMLPRIFIGIALASVAACHPPIQQLTARASFDMNCPEGQLVVTDLGERTKGVSGCGKRATYVFATKGGDYTNDSEGDWIMNTANESQQTPVVEQGAKQ